MTALKKYMGTLIVMILMLICFTLAMFHNNQNQGENKIQTVALKGSYLDGNRAIQMQEEETALENPTHFTLWGEMKNQKAVNPELSRTVDADVVVVKGDSSLVCEGGWNLAGDDLEGCIIDEKMAYALFGDNNAAGQILTWNKRDLVIRDVIDGDSGIIIVQEEQNREKIFGFIALDLDTGLNAGGDVKDWMSKHDIDGERIELQTFHRWGSGIILILPLLMAVPIFVPMFKKVMSIRRTPVKFILCASGLLIFFGIFLKISGYRIHFPEEMIPTRWSDFDFWTELYEQKSAEIGTLLKSEKSHVEMLMIGPFLQTVKYMLCSIILYLIFLRKIEINNIEVFAVYASVSIITVFLVIKSLGMEGRTLVNNQAVWLLMSFYFFGKLILDVKRVDFKFNSLK